MENCVFCRILQGHAEGSVVYEDETCVAIMDIQPVNPGHVLVIPRIHASHLKELAEKTGARMFTIGMKIDKALRKSGVKCEGVNFLLADGEDDAYWLTICVRALVNPPQPTRRGESE